MDAKRPPEVDAVKGCLTNYGIEEADHNNLGIYQALKECHGNIQNAAQYYVGKHFNDVPGYSGDADTNGGGDSSDEEYCNRPASKRRCIRPTKYVPTKSTNNQFTPKSKSTTTTTNHKLPTTGSCNGKSQGLGDSRKRKAEEGWFSSIKSPEEKEADASIAKQQRTERNRRPKKKKTATSAGGRASVRSATAGGRATRSSAQAPSQTSTQRRATRKSSYTSGNMGGDIFGDIVSTKKKGGNKSSKKKGGKKSCKVEDSVGEEAAVSKKQKLKRPSTILQINNVTRRAAILKIKNDYSLSLNKEDVAGWKIVWEVLEKKKWVSGYISQSSYYKWWFKNNSQNQLDPFERKVLGPNEDKSIKDFAAMLSLLADSCFNSYGIRMAIVPTADTIVGIADLDPVWVHLVHFVTSKKHSNDAFLDYLKENGNLCVTNDDYNQCYKAIDPHHVPSDDSRSRLGCVAATKAMNLFLEVAGVNLVGTKREEFPPFVVVWADFKKWLENNPTMQGLREAVKRLLSAQVELYRAWISTFTREERDAFYLETIDPKYRNYAEEMVERYWELNERCGCGQCDEACAQDLEWDHDEEKEIDGVNGVEQKRLDEEEFGSGEPTSYTRAQLIARRDQSTLRCPINHTLKNPIAIADPILSKKSYRPIKVTKYDLLFQLQAAAVGKTCAATGGETITKATWATYDGQHAAGMKNLRDGGVEYETAKLYERVDLYQNSWRYTEWRKNVFPEILKLGHLRRAVHRTIDLRLMPRIDLVLEKLRERNVEFDWPYEVVDDVLVRKAEQPAEGSAVAMDTSSTEEEESNEDKKVVASTIESATAPLAQPSSSEDTSVELNNATGAIDVDSAPSDESLATKKMAAEQESLEVEADTDQEDGEALDAVDEVASSAVDEVASSSVEAARESTTPTIQKKTVMKLHPISNGGANTVLGYEAAAKQASFESDSIDIDVFDYSTPRGTIVLEQTPNGNQSVTLGRNNTTFPSQPNESECRTFRGLSRKLCRVSLTERSCGRVTIICERDAHSVCLNGNLVGAEVDLLHGDVLSLLGPIGFAYRVELFDLWTH